jgi:phosphatidate cytidylyltransferase
MFRWRMILGTLIIAVLVGLCWLDHGASTPGIWLLPVALVVTVLASAEVLYLANAGGLKPLPWVVYLGNLLPVIAQWLPMHWLPAAWSPLGGVLAALAVGLMLAFAGEMRRFGKPEHSLANLATAVFALVYVGVLLAFVVQLRLQWNVGALASLIIVVKMGDTGAYAFGHLFGHHKMSPRLSPKKTWEGALGQLVFASLASWATFAWLVPWTTGELAPPGASWRWLLFGLVIGAVGMFGDLAESLLKRSVGCKDSSRWMPGFGGVLDILDSILIAAPAAWLCWAWGLVP